MTININHQTNDISASGAGSVTIDGTAVGGGGADLYSANESSPAAQPSATGGNAVAIGDSAVASGVDTFAIGFGAAATGNFAMTFGRGGAAGTNSTVLGRGTTGSSASDSLASGQSVVTNINSAALGMSYASGSNSFAASVANNTLSYGATGANSIAIGEYAKATATKGVAIGSAPQATAAYGVAIGHECQAPHQESVALGTRSQTRSKAHFAFGTGTLVSPGFAQAGMIVIHGRTGDATQGTLVSDSSLQALGTAGNSNQLIVPNYGAIAFDGILVARGRGSIGDTDSAAWKIEGLIRKESSSATTTLVNSAITVISNGPSWGIELSADTTNGALSVKVTGAASTNVKWVCTLRSSETLYNTY